MFENTITYDVEALGGGRADLSGYQIGMFAVCFTARRVGSRRYDGFWVDHWPTGRPTVFCNSFEEALAAADAAALIAGAARKIEVLEKAFRASGFGEWAELPYASRPGFIAWYFEKHGKMPKAARVSKRDLDRWRR